MTDIPNQKRIISQEEYIKDLSTAIDYLDVMNKDVNNVTLNNFIPMIRKKYKLNSQLK